MIFKRNAQNMPFCRKTHDRKWTALRSHNTVRHLKKYEERTHWSAIGKNLSSLAKWAGCTPSELIGRSKRKNNPSVIQSISAATQLSKGAVQWHLSKNNAPRFLNCFVLWLAARKRVKQVRGIFTKLQQRDRHRIRNRLAWKTRKINREKRRASMRTWRRRQRKNNPVYRLACSVRARLAKVLKRARVKKCHRTNVLIGCSAEQLKQHLELQFQPWMSWDNYGREWNIDHRKPIAAFDLRDERQLFEACHFSNLQPLSVFENYSKGARW
jgi:hypothetical protein